MAGAETLRELLVMDSAVVLGRCGFARASTGAPWDAEALLQALAEAWQHVFSWFGCEGWWNYDELCGAWEYNCCCVFSASQELFES